MSPDLFAQMLDIISNSSEQKELAGAVQQNQRYVKRMMATAGALFAAAFFAIAWHQSLEAVWLALGLGWLAWRCIRSADGVAQEAINIALIKDRVHFTQLLLASSSVDHLARSGLWDYLKIDFKAADAGDQWQASVLSSVGELKAALEVLPVGWAAGAQRQDPKPIVQHARGATVQ